MFRPHCFMISPTMACQAHCSYCFAPKSAQMMSARTLENAIDFIDRIAPEEGPINVIFHGGEPLLAGASFLESAFAQLRQRFAARLKLSVQSNLWALSGNEGEALAALLRDYKVKVGTSLDGPRDMCDSQRGQGYYDKTRAGMDMLKRYGIAASYICTFGKDHCDKASWVFEQADACYSIHGAVPSFSAECETAGNMLTNFYRRVCSQGNCARAKAPFLSPDEMARVYLESYEAYRSDPAHARISTIDAMVSACFEEETNLCLFSDCLGRFTAIAPDGELYSCQRMGGQSDYRLGNVNNHVSEDDILQSPGYLRLKRKQQKREAKCAGCAHEKYCKGGCLYNACVAGTSCDPYCSAYAAVFDRITRDMALEMAASMRQMICEYAEMHSSDEAMCGTSCGREANRAAAAQDGRACTTPLLAMAGQCRHPFDERVNCRNFALAVSASEKVPAERQKRQGWQERQVCQGHLGCQGHQEHQENPENQERQKRHDSSCSTAPFTPESFRRYCMSRLKALYLNMSYRCPLHCSHCSANAGMGQADELTAQQLADIVESACDLGFQRIEFSGGDPFAFRYFDELMELLEKIDRKGTCWLLRSSLGFPIERARLERAARIFDKTVVSVDGDEAFHDARRGKGTYRQALAHIESMLATPGRRCRIQICAVLSEEQRRSKEGAAVRGLSEALGLDAPQFHDLLPIGRACSAECTAPSSSCTIPPNFRPRKSCGIGESLSVEPDGRAFACYAQRETNCAVGDLSRESLSQLLDRGDLFAWRAHGVDTNERCRACDVRYLCGGMCLAWRDNKADIDKGDFACSKYDFYKSMAKRI